MQHLAMVFEILVKHNLVEELSKCEFEQPRLQFLGHIMAGDRVHLDCEKVDAMTCWPIPTTIKALRVF